jgi:hypothetical protein
MAELYQLIEAILRDVSQARYMSDMYSRQISFAYQADSLLRRFPVPRAEIDEVEFNLPFVVTGVDVDPNRHYSRNAAVGRIFDDCTLRIVRAGLMPVQDAFQEAAKNLGPSDVDKPKKAMADRFQSKILSDAFRATMHGRLLTYLNEETDEVMSAKENGPFNTEKAFGRIGEFVASVRAEPEVAAFESTFGSLQKAFDQATADIKGEVERMGRAVNHAYLKYPDYAVQVDVDPAKLQANPAAASYIKVKAAVKNYKWSKVDVDTKDMRNLRTLVPE